MTTRGFNVSLGCQSMLLSKPFSTTWTLWVSKKRKTGRVLKWNQSYPLLEIEVLRAKLTLEEESFYGPNSSVLWTYFGRLSP